MKLRRRILTTLLLCTFVAGIFTLVYVHVLDQQSHLLEPENRLFIRYRFSKNKKSLKTILISTTPNDSILDAIDSDVAAEMENSIHDSLLFDFRSNELRNSTRLNVSPSSNRVTVECPKVQPLAQSFKGSRYQDLVNIVLSKRNTKPSRTSRVYPTIQEILGIEEINEMSSIAKFYMTVNENEMYCGNDSKVDQVLWEMATMPITHVVEKDGGTQLKLLITFEDGDQAMMKPMRFGRNKETDPNHFYFVDFERHVSEIAAFHLDRNLGFRRTPPVVGRLLNITSEIYAVADDDLLKTFFISPANNLCFHGSCSHYCDTGHAICGRPDSLEGSLAMLLPPDTLTPRRSWRNPWRRSYHKRRKASWEVDDLYCDFVRATPPYNRPKRLLDIVDMSILDFLIGNMDRHHYETFELFGNDSFIIHLDHGRGFGRSNHDEITILAPLYQCCFLRLTTLRRLLELYYGPGGLSESMRCSLSKDPLHPVLNEKHLKALDRRLEFTLEVIQDCLKRTKIARFLYKD